MPITSEWYNPEKTILLPTFDGNWSLDDYHQFLERASGLIKSVDHNVIAIIDLSKSGSPPAQILSTGTRTERLNLSNNIQTIIFGMSRHMELLIGLFQRIFPKIIRELKVVGTWEDALAIAQVTLSEELS